jgi:hypothetical protein
LVLVAGMVLGTAFTLFFVPAIYVLLARDHRKSSQAATDDASSVPMSGVPSDQPAEMAYGVRVRGTVGTLVLAKRRRLVSEVRPILERMRAGGYFLSNALVDAACEPVGEAL